MILVRVDAFDDVAVTEAVAAVGSGAVSIWDDVVVVDGGWNRAVEDKVAADTSPSGINSNITKRQSVWFILKYPSSWNEDKNDVILWVCLQGTVLLLSRDCWFGLYFNYTHRHKFYLFVYVFITFVSF